MTDETVVAEIRDIIARLNIKAATWEWAIWKQTSVPRLHFLKITLLPSEAHHTSEVILDVASLSLSRSVTPLSEVNRFLDHCLAVRSLLAQIHVAPPDGIEFRIGPHNVQVIGNFPTSKVDFYGSVAAKTH